MSAQGRLLGIATKAKTRAPMREHATLAASERGLVGERAHPAARAITLLGREAWDEACAALGETLPWTLRRANLLVEGIALRESLGRRLRIGPVRLEVSEENPPCHVMDRLRPGLRAALEPDERAGVACRVLVGGVLSVGDAVRFED